MAADGRRSGGSTRRYTAMAAPPPTPFLPFLSFCPDNRLTSGRARGREPYTPRIDPALISFDGLSVDCHEHSCSMSDAPHMPKCNAEVSPHCYSAVGHCAFCICSSCALSCALLLRADEVTADCAAHDANCPCIPLTFPFLHLTQQPIDALLHHISRQSIPRPQSVSSGPSADLITCHRLSTLHLTTPLSGPGPSRVHRR